MKENINKKIDDALNSLEGIRKAPAPPFFFTRLEARMQRAKSVWENISSVISKPVFAFATICLVIMLNAFVIFSSVNTDENAASQSELATVDEYSQLNTPFYEFANTKP